MNIVKCYTINCVKTISLHLVMFYAILIIWYKKLVNCRAYKKKSYITLICKVESRADLTKCYRPVSLSNRDYKIISKVITIRLGQVLPKIIDIDQTCSVIGSLNFR